MAYKLIHIAFCLSVLSAIAQHNSQLTFTGKLLMDDFSSISYRINLTLGDFGDFTGMSYKDIFVETPKSYSITGFLDFQAGKISFKELNPISTKSLFETQNECYVHLSNATLKRIQTKLVIEGTFRSMTSKGETCYQGKIKLAGSLGPQLIGKFNKEKTISKIPELKEMDSLLLNNPKKHTLTKDSKEDIQISNRIENMAIDLWDEEIEDGDIIDIYLNEKLFRKDFKIKKKRQRLLIEDIEDELIIKITAKNTGRIFPNTVSILVVSEEHIYQLETKLKKNESASIDIKRKEE